MLMLIYEHLYGEIRESVADKKKNSISVGQSVTGYTPANLWY